MMVAPTIDITNIPAPRVPFTDGRTGLISREWYRFLLNLFALTGGGKNDTPLDDLLVVPPQVSGAADVAPFGVDAPLGIDAQIAELQKQLMASDLAPPIFQDSVQRLNYLDFEVDARYASRVGRLGWNITDETLNLGLPYNITQQVGLETFARVQNNTGVLIPNGALVGFAGASVDGVLEVAPYLADGSQPSLYVIGIMTHDLPDTGTRGYCTVWGSVRDIDTTGASAGETWAIGDILYASTTIAGGFTKAKPTVPNAVIPVAAVLTVGATDGMIFVRPTIEQDEHCGTFTKTDSQTPAAINTAYPLTFNSTELSHGVNIGVTTSHIEIQHAGLYAVQCSVQLTSGNATQKAVRVWFRLNGTTDYANSSRLVSIAMNGGYVVVSLSITYPLSAGDFIEVMFSSDDTNITVSTVASTAFAPAAPAAVITVTQTQQ